MSAKTIMFVVNVDWFFLSHRLPIALEAKKRGYNVHVAARVTENLDLLQSYDFIVHPLVLDRSSTGLGSAISTFLQLYKILSLVKPDLVHLVTIKPVLLGGLAARFVGVPSVVAAISGLGYIFVSKNFVSSVRRAIVGVLYRLALGHSNLKVIFQNKDDKKSVCKLASLPTSKTELIAGSGVDLAQYCVAPFPKSEVIVMLPARLLGDKGVREFVKASQHLQFEILHFDGDVNMSNSTTLKKQLFKIVSNNKSILLDMTKLNFIDSSGIATLIEGFHKAQSSGLKFVIVGASNLPLKMLELSKLDQVFTLVNSIQDIDFYSS